MQIEILTFCKYASEHALNLTIVDTFEKWRVCEDLSFKGVGVAKVRFFAGEEGPHKVGLRMVDPDGKVLFEKEWNIDVTMQGDRAHMWIFRSQLNGTLPIGHYALSLVHNGKTCMDVPLYVHDDPAPVSNLQIP